MNITPEFKEYIQQAVKAGQFRNEDEALNRALQLLQEEAAELEQERAKVRSMVEQGLKGPFKPLDVEKFKQEAQAKWKDKQSAQ